VLGLFAALAVTFLGIYLRSGILTVIGLAAVLLQVVLDWIKPLASAPVSQAAPPRPRHRLIQAPDDAWKVPEDDIWQAMMSGPTPMSIGGQPDFMNVAMGGFANPHVRGALRSVLPFQNYGRAGPLGAVENLFLGMPISLGNFFQTPEHRHFPP